MFVLALLLMVVWLFLGSSHFAIHVIQASSARGELLRIPSRNCLKSPDSPKTKAVEAYETGKKSSACCGMPAISAHETLLSDFLDSFGR